MKAVALKRFLTGGGIRLENCAHRGDSSLAMKSILVSIVAAVVLVGCGESSGELLLQSVREGNVKAVKQHLAGGADINVKGTNQGMTPLHLAVNNNQKEIVELLIAAGADVNAKRTGGATPLDFSEGKPKIAALLRKHGAKHSEQFEQLMDGF